MTARQGDHLEDGVVHIDPVLARRRLLGQGANPGDDFAGSVTVGDDELGALPRLLQVLSREPVHARRGVVDHGGERLVDFMTDRGRQLS